MLFTHLSKAVVTGALVALVSSASAATIGTLDPNIALVPTPGSRSMTAFTPVGAFEQQYNFQSASGGVFSGSFSWSGYTTINSFAAALYSSNASYDPGSKIADFSASPPRGLVLDWNGITAGYYYVLVSGTQVGAQVGAEAPARVSGEFAIRIPEPSIIGLLGLGLAGIGLFAIRRRT